MGERAERGAEAAVGHDRRGAVQHLVLRHPALDRDVGRQRAELGVVALLADGEQEARGERRERLDRGAVERGIERQVPAGGDRAEAHVDERLALARRGGRHLGAAEAQRLRAGAGPPGPRARDGIEVRYGSVPMRPAARSDTPRTAATPSADAGDRDAVFLGHERRRVLPALADDQVRPPLAGERAQAREHRPHVEHAEEVGDHSVVPFVEPHPRELRQQRHPLLVGRGAERRERQAGPRDVRLEAVLRGDEHVVTGAPARRRVRDQRPQVARATARGEEHAHCSAKVMSAATWMSGCAF